MTHHTHETNNTTETPREPLDNTTELGGDAPLYENQPPAQFSYDPRNLGTLTAHDMSAIEKAINASRDAGSTPKAIQDSVDTRLRLLGIDPDATRDNNGLVVRFVDVNGKEDIRPIVIDSEDFGTHIRNAEMCAVEEDGVEEGNASTIDGADAEGVRAQGHAEMHVDDEDVEATDDSDLEKRRAQERLIDTLLEAPLRDIQGIEGRIEEHALVYDRRHREIVSELLDKTGTIIRALRNNEPIEPHRIRALTDLTPGVIDVIMKDIYNAEEEMIQTNSFSDSLGAVQYEASRRGLSSAVSESLDEVLRRTTATSHALTSNREAHIGAMVKADQQARQLDAMLTDMRSNRRVDVAQIYQALTTLEHHLSIRQGLSRESATLIRSIKQILMR